MRRRFFVDRFDGNSASLRDEAAAHLGRVLRAEPGQLYELSDGERVWLARVERVAVSKRGPNSIDFALVEPIEAVEPRVQISLLVAIVKFDRFEWCLEKATELGAEEIIPLAAARTQKALLAAAGKRHERWKRIVLESAQQSRRLRPPALHAVSAPEKVFVQSEAQLKIFFSERRDARPLHDVLRTHSLTQSAPPSATLSIGPEGGWSDEEIATARAANFVEASLGENILRTETAVVASLAVVRFALRADSNSR
jgi:16S rRNA (uracil1498-N3)-methyltransferase